MKKTFITAAAIMATAAALAQPPAGDAKAGDFYGEKPTAENVVAVAQIPALLEKKPVFDTKIKAKVLDVCPKKGCWLKLAVNDSTTAFVKMKDYAFFLPTAIIGKTIILEGEAKTITNSVEELKHYAEDAKKSKKEIDAITVPKKEIRFTAKGIVVTE